MKKKYILISISIISITTFLFFGGRVFLFKKIRNSITEKVDALGKNGIRITYDSLELNPWSGHLYSSNVKIRVGEDSAHLAINAEADELTINGLNILSLLLKNELSIGTISLSKPLLIYVKKNKWSTDSTSTKQKDQLLKHLAVNSIHLKEASILISDSVVTDTTFSMQTTLQLKDFIIAKEKDSLIVKQGDLTLSASTIRTPKAFYSYTVQQLHFNLQQHLFEMDSAKVIPIYDRDTFMKKYGEQTSRIEASISHLSVNDLLIATESNQLTIHPTKAAINFKIKVYRDKRYPFLKKTIAELPMEFMQKLNSGILIDTIKVKDSYVWYEEFPEKGDSVGHVFFEELNATISHLHNKALKDEDENEDVKMHTTALFMGKGKLDAHFTFPADTARPYKVHGSLKDFPLASVNSILVPSFQTRIESGLMSNFKFNFLYNKTRSDGTVELNYDQLKIISLKKDKNDNTTISKFKTAVINLFVLKRNSEDTERGYKKNGTVLYYRDPHRAIFHFWWKSLFSGLVTAYKLDGLVPDLKDHGKEISKEIKDKSRK